MTISAIVITQNEENMLPACLKSLDWVDELVVVDAQSRDKTLKIAAQHQAKIISVDAKSDYSHSRNAGKKAASGDWIFYVDADERITEELKSEIKQTISGGEQVISYKIPRKNIMLGKWLKHGGFWPDYMHRLFHRSALINWQGKLHESPQVRGDIKKLKQPIIHYTARTIKLSLQKSAQWSQVEAQLFFKAKASKVTWWRVLKAFISQLYRVWIKKRGFLDGSRGFILGFIQAHHQASVFINLWQLQNEI